MDIDANIEAEKKRKRNITRAFIAASLIGIILLIVGCLTTPEPTAPVSVVPSESFATYTPLPTRTPMPITIEPYETATPEPLRNGVILADVWVLDAPGGETFACALLAGSEVGIVDEEEGYLLVLFSAKRASVSGWVASEWVREY